MPLPEESQIAARIDGFATLPVTPRGNTYMLIFTDRFRRRGDMYAVTVAQFTAEGTANTFINRYNPLWGCPRSILSDDGLYFRSKLSQVVYKLVGVREVAISSHYPNLKGGVERVNHMIAQKLAIVVNEFQTNWDQQLPQVEFEYNHSVSAAIGLAPNEVHMGRHPCLPLTIFKSTGVAGQ